MADEPIRAPRCASCGAWHPFIQVCPYIRRQVVRYEPLKGGQRAEIVETEFFAGRLGLARHSLQSDADVRAALEETAPSSIPSEPSAKAPTLRRRRTRFRSPLELER